MAFADILYACLLVFFTIGGMFGLFYFEFRSNYNKADGIAKFVRIGRVIFVGSFAVSWAILVILFITLPESHWTATFLTPPLFLIAILSLWQIVKKIKAGNGKSNNKIVWPFVGLMVSVISLICIQFLLRFSNLF